MPIHVVPSSVVSSSRKSGGVREHELRPGTWAAVAMLVLSVILPAKATSAQEVGSEESGPTAPRSAASSAAPIPTTSAPPIPTTTTPPATTTPPVAATPVAEMTPPPGPVSLMNLPTRGFNVPPEGYGTVAPWECSPQLRAGTQAFGDMLVQASGGLYTYDDVRPCGASWGITYSQHKTGRAIDFMVDSRNLQGHLDGLTLLNWLFEPLDGVPHARLRRLGIVEIIWDGRIWSAASDAANTSSNPASWRPYTGLGCSGDPIGQGTECHFDHFHFTLSESGSSGLVTFYTPPPPA